MVIHNSDIGRAIFRPAKDNPPLIVDPNGVTSIKGAFEGFQAVTRRNREIGEAYRLIHLNELS